MTKTELFEATPIPKALVQLSVPTIISSLVMVLYNLADTYFVGMLGDPVQNAAVTLAAPVLLAFNAINNLFGVGSSSMMSRALGRKDFETVAKSSSLGFWCAAAGGALISCFAIVFHGPLLVLLGADEVTLAATSEYMKWTVCCGAVPAILNVVLAYLVRAEGRTAHASVGTMSGCILNMILDPVFILPWGLNMDAAGAGLATFLSNCVACGYFFILLLVRKEDTSINLNPKHFGLQRAIVVGVLGVGLPAAIQNLLNVTGMTVLNNFTASFGSDAVAAMGIAQKINMVPLYVAMGISQGIMPLVGYNYASGNGKRMKDAVVLALGVSLTGLGTVMVLYYICAGGLIRMFMDNEIIIAYGSRFLRAMCFAIPLLCMDFVAVGVFQAAGMGKQALIFAILRKIVLEIPALFLFNRLLPLYGLAYAQPFAELILAIAALVMLRRIFCSMMKAKAP